MIYTKDLYKEKADLESDIMNSVSAKVKRFEERTGLNINDITLNFSSIPRENSSINQSTLDSVNVWVHL